MIAFDRFHMDMWAESDHGAVSKRKAGTVSGTDEAAFRGPLAAAFARRSPAPADGGGRALAGVLATVLAPPASALPVPPASDRTVWGSRGRADAATVAAVVARAESDLRTAWPVPLASQAAR